MRSIHPSCTILKVKLGVLKCIVSLSTVVLSIQVNEKSFDLKEGIYRDGIKRRETRPGWMDAVAMVMTFEL